MIHPLLSRIQAYIQERGEATPKQITSEFGLSAVTTHRYLKILQKSRHIQKFGSAPKVFYRTTHGLVEISASAMSHVPEISPVFRETIIQYFYSISPSGIVSSGIVAFDHWVQKRHLDYAKTAAQYHETIQKYDSLKNHLGLIDATSKMRESFPQTNLKKMYYVDFYSHPVFGKTRLGTLLLHAKQTMNADLIDQTIAIAQPKITSLIQEYNIDALAFVPPTIARKVQFMTELAKKYAGVLPIIHLEKAKNAVAIQQKTLKVFQERVENAQNTLFVGDNRQFKNVLIIDDAVGSGATIAVVSQKLLQQKIAQNTYAVSVVGSANAKEFEVINEV